MLLIAGLLIATQVASVHGLRFNFAVDVEQCNPFIISFAGSNLKAIPAFLSMIPVNSTAITVPLQDPTIVSTGIALTFLPFPAGSDFLTSLDGSTGENLILVSDLKRVLPSPTGNSSCVTPQSLDVRRRFTVNTSVSQCEQFTIIYDTSVVPRAPIVRLYSPKGPSFLLDPTSDNTTAGTATYMMNFGQGREVILLMGDGGTIRETSPLIRVLGDNSSSTKCLSRNANAGGSAAAYGLDGDRVGRRAVVIGGATGGSAVVLIGICIATFIVRDRRRRRRIQGTRLPSEIEKTPDDKKRVPDLGQFPHPADGIINNPIYTMTPFLSPTRSDHAIATRPQVVPEDQAYSESSTPSPWVPQSPDFRASLRSLDIEGMLNMATLQSRNPSRKNSALGLVISPSVRTPSPTFLRPGTSRRHLRDPSDVPTGPASMAFSEISVDPFEVPPHPPGKPE